LAKQPAVEGADRALDLLVRRLAQLRPKPAGALACQAAERAIAGGAVVLPKATVAALAQADQRCPAGLDALLANEQCRAELACGSRACSPSDLHAEVAAEVARAPQDAAWEIDLDATSTRYEHLLLAAAAAQGSDGAKRFLERARAAPGCAAR
jgi:hypothetical protein